MQKNFWLALSALLVFGVPLAIAANNTLVTASSNTAVNVNASLTRPANVTAYTANTAVCASTTVVCVPLSFSIGLTPGGTVTIQQVKLTKSGSATTSATFIVWLYNASPTVSTTIKDNVAYTGPFAADWANWIGSATCSTAISGSDSNVFYDCTLSQNVLLGKSATSAQTIFALIEVTGAWTPASAEVLQVALSGYQD